MIVKPNAAAPALVRNCLRELQEEDVSFIVVSFIVGCHCGFVEQIDQIRHSSGPNVEFKSGDDCALSTFLGRRIAKTPATSTCPTGFADSIKGLLFEVQICSRSTPVARTPLTTCG